MKRIILLVLLMAALKSYAQIALYVGGNPWGVNPVFNLHKSESDIKEVKSYYAVIKMERKIRLDKSISVGMMMKPMKFVLSQEWVNGTDWLTYCRDQGIEPAKYELPQSVSFDYIFFPVELSHYTRRFRFAYGIGINVLMNKPYYAGSSKESNVPIAEKYWRKSMLEQDFTVAYNIGNSEVSLSYNWIAQSFLVKPDYDVLVKTNYKPMMVAISYTYKFKLLKRKHA